MVTFFVSVENHQQWFQFRLPLPIGKSLPFGEQALKEAGCATSKQTRRSKRTKAKKSESIRRYHDVRQIVPTDPGCHETERGKKGDKAKKEAVAAVKGKENPIKRKRSYQ